MFLLPIQAYQNKNLLYRQRKNIPISIRYKFDFDFYRPLQVVLGRYSDRFNFFNNELLIVRTKITDDVISITDC